MRQVGRGQRRSALRAVCSKLSRKRGLDAPQDGTDDETDGEELDKDHEEDGAQRASEVVVRVRDRPQDRRD